MLNPDTLPQSDYRAFYSAMRPEEYLAEGFTKNTVAEIDFAMDVCDLAAGRRVLDVGCGPGRHALELARRGVRVTGVDFTPQFIAWAGEQAEREGIGDRTEFIVADARDFVRPLHFDAAICLCEGGFALLQTDEDNVRVLRHIAASLKPGGVFLLTTLNGYRSIRRAGKPEDAPGGVTLDPQTMVESWTPDVAGRPEQVFAGRHYIVPELVKMHSEAGLRVEIVWGGTAGQWNKQPLDWDEIEVMLLSRKG